MKRIKLAAIILIIAVVIISAGIWWFGNSASSETSTDIFASGFIEAKDISIAPEVGGRIVYIAVAEGDEVKAGVPLIELDDSLLKAQQRQAEATVKLAQAGLEQAIASRNQAIVSRDGAKKAWENALDVQRNPLELEAKIIAAQGELDMAELALLREEEIEKDWRVPAAELRLDTARKILENLESYEALGLVSLYQMRKELYPAQGELRAAELNLHYQKELEKNWIVPAAELRRDIAKRTLENLLAIRDNPQEINMMVDEARTAYQTAVAAVEVAEKAVEAAARQVEQAEASLEIVKAQLSKLSISSPVSGVVAAQYAEVGEIAQPGAPILTITVLEEVTLTAYVPESKIGLIKLGQEALVSVDSYPEESFIGEVVYISPRALFTPRNIQLKEEREKTVFVVKIRLANPEQKLKPGMPADVRILTDS